MDNTTLRENIFNFGVDYLEVYGKLKGMVDIARGLDSDNSYYKYFGDFTVSFENNIKNYEYKLTFWKDDVPCFGAYSGVLINDYIETKDYVCFYGSAFRVLSEEYIRNFIQENIAFEKVKRIDLCIDLTLPIDEVLGYFKDIKQIGSKFFGAGGQVETMYIGEKKRKNKQTLVRIYNKIADIYAKGKQKLMAEYLLRNDVTRIEIEFREEICHNLAFSSLYDRKYLLDMFYSYIEKYTTIFEGIEHEKIILKRLQKNFDPESISTQKLVPGRHRKLFLGYAKRVLEYFSCPVDILLRYDLVSETTLIDLGLSFQNGKFDLQFYKLGATVRNTKMVFGEPPKQEKEEMPF